MESEELDKKKFLRYLSKIEDEMPLETVNYLKGMLNSTSKKGMKSAIIHAQSKLVEHCLELDWLSDKIK